MMMMIIIIIIIIIIVPWHNSRKATSRESTGHVNVNSSHIYSQNKTRRLHEKITSRSKQREYY